MGRALHQAHRRNDRGAEERRRAGVLGRPAVDPRAEGDGRHAVYLNELYRARAEKAGITYIDVWDGFVDEAGRFTLQGPDFEGQTRRLRAGDGVHFTKAGARKLAHYVEREIQRVSLPGSEPVALPASEPQAPTPRAQAGRRRRRGRWPGRRCR